MDFIGKPTINPVLFWSGKLAGYFLILVYIFGKLDILVERFSFMLTLGLANILFFIGLIVIVLSIVNMGASIRVGLPAEATVLKRGGLYSYSRNPIYFGLHLLSLAAMLYTMNVYVFILGLYSFIIYHYIILAEEKFLENRFGADYIDYKKMVRRYI